MFLFLLGYGRGIEQYTHPLSSTSPSNGFLFPFISGFVRGFGLSGLILLCIFYIHCDTCVMVIWLQFREWDWVVIWPMHTNRINEETYMEGSTRTALGLPLSGELERRSRNLLLVRCWEKDLEHNFGWQNSVNEQCSCHNCFHNWVWGVVQLFLC